MGMDGVNNTAPTWQTTETKDISTTNKTNEKSGILNKVLNKLAEGRDFILNKLGNKTNALITIGQVGGAAAMTVGGLALIFGSIGASLTVGGFPLAIPLLAGGGVLFAAGTGLLIAKLSTQASALDNKIKEFFKVTGKNAALGIAGGIASAALFSKVALTTVVAAAPGFVAKIKEGYAKGKEGVGKACDVADKVNNVVHPELAKEDKAVQKDSTKKEENKADIGVNSTKDKEDIKNDKNIGPNDVKDQKQD